MAARLETQVWEANEDRRSSNVEPAAKAADALERTAAPAAQVFPGGIRRSKDMDTSLALMTDEADQSSAAARAFMLIWGRTSILDKALADGFLAYDRSETISN